MLRYAREAAPVVVASIVVPGALLVSTPWTSSAAARLGHADITKSVAAMPSASPSPPAAANAEPADASPARAAVAAVAAFTALALGTALAGRGNGGA